MASKPYEKFMTSEPWRDGRTRFGFNQASWSEEIDQIVNTPTMDLADPRIIAEIGCGTALHLIDVAKKFPHASCFGFEPSENMFEFAKQNVLDQQVTNNQLSRLAADDISDRF